MAQVIVGVDPDPANKGKAATLSTADANEQARIYGELAKLCYDGRHKVGAELAGQLASPAQHVLVAEMDAVELAHRHAARAGLDLASLSACGKDYGASDTLDSIATALAALVNSGANGDFAA